MTPSKSRENVVRLDGGDVKKIICVLIGYLVALVLSVGTIYLKQAVMETNQQYMQRSIDAQGADLKTVKDDVAQVKLQIAGDEKRREFVKQ